MEKIIFSKEQENVFEYAQKGILNMIIQSVAGSGKTTTLVECVKRLPKDKTILLLAHNKSTKDTLKERLGDVSNVKIYTLHGLGWRMFLEHFEKTPELDEDKYKKYIFSNIQELGGEQYMSLSAARKMIYKSNIIDMVYKSRQNLKQSEKEIKKLCAKKYGMTMVANECAVVEKILKWGSENLDTVDYQDLITLPYEYGYYTQKFLADFIMLDEAQDASIAQEDIIMRCFKRNTRLFAVGDAEQKINGWSGSDTDAFEHLKDSDKFRRDAEEFELTTNYRCGKKIIDYAKKYSDSNIHAKENAIDGAVNFDVSIDFAMNGDMILCRNVSPLMDVYRLGISKGKKMYFRGEELGNNLITNVLCCDGNTIQEIVLNLKKRLITTWDLITEDSGLEEKETMTDPRIVSLLDTIKTLQSLPSTVETRDDLKLFIKDVFSDEGKDGIQLSTIHRAKGLEADNVFVICPSLIPSRLATLDWQIEEERHLQYVMCTRPKKNLNFVSEKEIKPPFIFFDNKSLYKELTEIRKELTK